MRPGRRKLRAQVKELETRVEGLETLLADLMENGRIVAQLPPPPDDALSRLARQVEAESNRPSRRYRL